MTTRSTNVTYTLLNNFHWRVRFSFFPPSFSVFPLSMCYLSSQVDHNIQHVAFALCCCSYSQWVYCGVYIWGMIHVWHSLVNVVPDFILSVLFEKSEVSEVKSSPPLYAQRFVILQPNCQPADLMVFKFNCNTFNSILCSVTPDQIDILVSNSSQARCISYDGFFKWWIWFHYVTIWNTWGTTI